MKTIKLLLVAFLAVSGFTACTNTVYVEDDYVEPTITLDQLINSYELWYIDINQSSTNGDLAFMQIAFTLSFRDGVLFANNNMVGFGSTGSGFGIDVGYYNAYGNTLQLDHDLDGVWNFTVQQLSDNRIRLYNYETDNSYVLRGYQRSTFDYDYVFYENIHYFLQEYDAWEKVATSQQGAINDFDAENYLAFLSEGYGDTFLSSTDPSGFNPGDLYWDYEGIYEVLNVDGNDYLKVLTLDYDYLGNEYFELSVIDDQTIELYHPYSGTTYRFRGRGYISYMRTATNTDEKGKAKGKRELRMKEENRTFKAEDFKKIL